MFQSALAARKKEQTEKLQCVFKIEFFAYIVENALPVVAFRKPKPFRIPFRQKWTGRKEKLPQTLKSKGTIVEMQSRNIQSKIDSGKWAKQEYKHTKPRQGVQSQS